MTTQSQLPLVVIPKFETPFTFEEHHEYYAGEVNNDPSETVPDMDISISDLLANYTSYPDLQRQGLYEEDPDIETGMPHDIDLTDLDDFRQEIKQTHEKLRREQESAKKPTQNESEEK